MPKIGKIILLCTMFVLIGTCLFYVLAPSESKKIELVEAEESIDYTTSQIISGDHILCEANGNFINVVQDGVTRCMFNSSLMTIDIVYVNFKDKIFFTEDTKQYYYNQLDSLSNYFWEESRHALSIKFNVYVYSYDGNSSFGNQPYTFNGETDFFNNAIATTAVKLIDTGKESDAHMLVFSNNTYWQPGTIFNPHVWAAYDEKDTPLLCITTKAEMAVYKHEMYHLLGLLDLYNKTEFFGDSLEFIGNTDIMAVDYSKDGTTSAYNKYVLGWLDEGMWADNTTNAIENIYTNGTYTLQKDSNVFGTMAYKFGSIGDEFFILEQRIVNNTPYIIIQRINTKYRANYNASNQQQCYILTAKTVSHKYMFAPGDAIIQGKNNLYYSNSSIANYYINNITINEDLSISFDFFNSYSDGMEDAIATLTTTKVLNNYYVNLVDQFGSFVDVSEIYYFNTITGYYEKVYNVSVVYINNTPFYALIQTNAKYVRCKMVYTGYLTSVTKEFEFNKYMSHYFITIEKNVVQQTGDVFQEVKDLVALTISRFFDLFK